MRLVSSRRHAREQSRADYFDKADRPSSRRAHRQREGCLLPAHPRRPLSQANRCCETARFRVVHPVGRTSKGSCRPLLLQDALAPRRPRAWKFVSILPESRHPIRRREPKHLSTPSPPSHAHASCGKHAVAQRTIARVCVTNRPGLFCGSSTNLRLHQHFPARQSLACHPSSSPGVRRCSCRSQRTNHTTLAKRTPAQKHVYDCRLGVDCRLPSFLLLRP